MLAWVVVAFLKVALQSFLIIIVNYLFPDGIAYICTSSLLTRKTKQSQLLTQWNDTVIRLL